MRTIFICGLILSLTACGPREMASKGKPGYSKESQAEIDVYLLPMPDFDSHEVDRLARNLQLEHGFEVKWMRIISVTPRMYVPARNQYLADEMASEAVAKLNYWGIDPTAKPIIVLTRKDINLRGFRQPFLLDAQFDADTMTVISTARINPINYRGKPDKKLLRQRLHKLANKSLGLHYYGYAESSDPTSVMFGPVNSAAELDQVREGYTQ